MRKSELRKIREERILSTLAKGRIMTAAQLRAVGAGGLDKGGQRNALRVLAEMERDGLVVSKNVGVKLFALPGSRFGHWEHQLILVDFLIWKGWFKTAEIERPLMKGGEVLIVPDAVIRLVNGIMAIEVDRRQKLRTNREKMEIYKREGIPFCVVCYKERGKYWEGCVKYYIEDFR